MATNSYLQISSVPGDSTDSLHRNWFDISIINFQPVGSQGGGNTKLTGLKLDMSLSVSTAPLYNATVSGWHLSWALLEVVRHVNTKSMPMLRLRMSDLLVTSYQTSGSSVGDPIVSVGLEFAFYKIEYGTLQNPLVWNELPHAVGKRPGQR